MTLPGGPALFEVLEATWPPARTWRDGPWTLRDGAGGGKRVSAATAAAPVTTSDIDRAEARMLRLGQDPLFMLRPGDAALDTALAARGYSVVEPTVLYAAPVDALTTTALPPVSAFAIWPPLAIQRDLWAAGGIGPGRRAVMVRAARPKTAILARHRDRPAGVAFVALSGAIAMVHAIEVAPALRRQGVGLNTLRAAAHWARDRGADTLSLAVTRANAPANALYASLGMTIVENYHYRTK